MMLSKIKNTANSLNPQDKSRRLHDEILFGNIKRVQALLTSGVDPNTEDEDGDTPCIAAIKYDEPEILQLLINNKAQVNRVSSLGQTALQTAIEKKDEDMVKILLNAGATQIPEGQTFFIDRMQKYGLLANDEGICFGMIGVAMQKFFSGKIQEFLQQIQLIASIPKEDFKDYLAYQQNVKIKCVELAKKAVCEQLMKQYALELKSEDLWSTKLSVTDLKKLSSLEDKVENNNQFHSLLAKKVNEKIKEYELENKDDGLAADIPAVFEAIDAYLFARRYLHLFPDTYDLIFISDEKRFKETQPKFGQLLLILGENQSLTYKVLTPLNDVAVNTLTQDELQTEFREKYTTFTDALISKDFVKLKEFLPNILVIASKNDHTLTKGIPVDNQNFLQTLVIFASKTLQEDIVELDSICGIYTKEELEFYFTSLYEAFEKFPGKIAFELENKNHAMGMFYDLEKSSQWGFLDPNQMPLHLLSKQELAKQVLNGFHSEKMLGLNLRMYVHKKDLALALTHLHAWKKHSKWQAMHVVTKYRAKLGDDSNATWLNLAVKHRHLSLAKALLTVGADPKSEEDKGSTLLHVAAQNGKTELIKLLHTYGAELDSRKENGMFPLYIAAQEGQLDTVKYLLDSQIDPNTENNSGYISLFGAALYNHLDVLNLLVAANSDVNKLGLGESVLLLAAGKGYVDIVKALINAGAKIDVASDDIPTAIYLSAQNGHTDTVKILVAAKANLEIKFRNKTPLQIAVEKGHLSCVQILLAADKYESLNKLDSNRTLLMRAAENGQIETVRELLSIGADYNTINSSGYNALYYAAQNGHLDVVNILLKTGAKLNFTKRDWYSIFVNIGIKSDVRESGESCDKLGAHIFLFKSVEQNNLELVELLIKNQNLDPDHFLDARLYALRNIIGNEPSVIHRLEDLLKKKTINLKNILQITPLELAIVLGNVKIIHCLQNKVYPVSQVVCSLWNRGMNFSSASERPIGSNGGLKSS